MLIKQKGYLERSEKLRCLKVSPTSTLKSQLTLNWTQAWSYSGKYFPKLLNYRILIFLVKWGIVLKLLILQSRPCPAIMIQKITTNMNRDKRKNLEKLFQKVMENSVSLREVFKLKILTFQQLKSHIEK